MLGTNLLRENDDDAADHVPQHALGDARDFFGAVFGWPCHEGPWFQTPDLKAGLHGQDPAPQIYVYFNVANLEASAARIRAAGGETEDPTDEPGFGRFINCRAPGGIQFGLHQSTAS